MALRLMEKIPVLGKSLMFQKYATYLYQSEFKIDPLLWIISSFIIGALFAAGAWYTAFELVGLEQHIQVGVLVFIVSIDLLVGFPYFKAEQRVDQIEEDLPDVLKQMADTLKSGGTYEYALREIANSEFGYLKKEVNEVLRKLEEGENFENALKTLSNNVDSRIVKRTVTIIIDSIRAGAGLANVLEEIAEDVREAHRIGKERRARTSLQVIFMFVAGGLIAPAIFGFVSTIADILVSASASAVSAEKAAESRASLDIIQLAIQIYLFIETTATGIMISMMREGKMSKSIIYIPILMCIAYISYLVAALISGAMVGVG